MFEIDNVPASLFATAGFPFWEILIKSTIVIAAAALVCKLLNRQSAAIRHRVWVFGLAASLVVPMASLLLPQVTLRVLPSSTNSSRSSSTSSAGKPFTISAARSSVPRAASDAAVARGASDTESSAESIAARLAITQRTANASDELSASAAPGGPSRVFLFCWLPGTMFSTALFLISLVVQSNRLRRLRPISDNDWNDSVIAAARTLGLRRPIVALESDENCVPAVVGVLSPRLVVPRNWRTWSRTQRHCILLHELAHVKRRDVSTQLLGRLALMTYWFNPLVWYAVRQLRAERELASDDCVLLAGQTASDYAEQLLRTLRCYRPVRVAMGVAMAHSARLDQRVLAILDPRRRRDPVGLRFAIVLPCLVGIICGLLGGVTLATRTAAARQPEKPTATAPVEAGDKVWQENYAVEYPGRLPVSVAFSADGKTLLTGDTNGEIMALIFVGDSANYKWKTNVEGSHAAIAFSADQKTVFATTKNGVRILDAAQGKEQGRFEAKDSAPTAIGVFPDKTIQESYVFRQIVFGNARGYQIKSWAKGKLPESVGTIETSTVAKDAKPVDEAAVPLAVDPKGRSAIMTGPIDATGQVGGRKGKNVLWAYVCGDYSPGSPGNRVMVGHMATVVSAAWAKTGDVAVTGDDAGRVIVWDSKTMKEKRRLELGGRVAALAISNDGQRVAAYVFGKQGDLYVWETARPTQAMKPIHSEQGDFAGPTAYASLSFSPDGKRLAGCAIDKRWLTRLGELIGKVRVWELAAAPASQPSPKQVFLRNLPKGNASTMVVLNNDTILTPSPKSGALNFISVADGGIQIRLGLGKFRIGTMKLSSDRRWLAIAQHALQEPRPTLDFEVGIWDMKTMKQKATLPQCRELLDVAAGGKIVAVVREERIEIWDVAGSKLLKAAPFTPKRIDAASLSPDGSLLAISDLNHLVLWRWEENTNTRIGLGRRVGSLAFSPNGKFLAEGPAPRENIQIRDLETGKVVQTLSNSAKQSMNVPRMAFAQGGRVLIAGDNITFVPGIAVPHRINLWDTATGRIAHQIALPAGLPIQLDVSPNGRNLIALLDDGDAGMKLGVWRLDGRLPAKNTGAAPPATTKDR